MTGVLICGRKEETGSEVSWGGAVPCQCTMNSSAPCAEALGPLSLDCLDGVVVLLRTVVVRISIVACLVQRHMLLQDVKLTSTELTLMPLPKL